MNVVIIEDGAPVGVLSVDDAARGVTSEVAGVSRQVEGVGNKTA